MIILDIDKPERCGKCPMHNDGNDYCKLAHDHASFVRAKGCPIQTIKTGHWIKPKSKVKPFGDDTIQCDMCGFFTDVDCNYNYCPNCGAKMQEVEE